MSLSMIWTKMIQYMIAANEHKYQYWSQIAQNDPNSTDWQDPS